MWISRPAASRLGPDARPIQAPGRLSRLGASSGPQRTSDAHEGSRPALRRPTSGRLGLPPRRDRQEAPPGRGSPLGPGRAWGRREWREPPSAGSSPGWRQALPGPAPPGSRALAGSGSCDRSGGVSGRGGGRAGLGEFPRPPGAGRESARPGGRPDSEPQHAGQPQRSWRAGSRGPRSGAAAAPAPETREHLFKVLVIGELGVGKTSIIKRYVHQLFSQHYRATIGVDFALKVLNWDSRTLVRLQLWDIAGQERFGNMTRVYYKEAVGAFVVFDISRSSTFEAVLKWKSDLDSKVHLPNGSPIPAVLLANKCDQNKDSSQTPSQMDQFCKEHGFAGWFETSAKDNINIEEAARFLVEKILANHQSFPNEENDVGKIKLDQETLRAESKSQCC
uniref:Ras-related protein Rab n=1 Tax=Macaca fascicularis TaxID=9541 RepID=A0A7N9IC63_MACFA